MSQRVLEDNAAASVSVRFRTHEDCADERLAMTQARNLAVVGTLHIAPH
jgi:hypothetical protein